MGGMSLTRLGTIAAVAGLAVSAAGGAAMGAKPPKPPAPTLSVSASTTHVTYGGAGTGFRRLTGTGGADAPLAGQQAAVPYKHNPNPPPGRPNAPGASGFRGGQPALATP